MNFNDKDCVFRLDESIFSLTIEDIEERDKEIPLSEAFGFRIKPRAELPSFTTLTAMDFDKGKTIHFHIKKAYETQSKSFTVSLDSYIVFQGKETSFDSLKVQADELNWFYPIKSAFERFSFSNDGEAQLELNAFDKTTEEFEFSLLNKMIKGNLSVGRKVNVDSTNPLQLSSNLTYHFEETKDVSVPKELFLITKHLLTFISYRQNSHINKVLLGKKKDNEYNLIGDLYINHSQTGEKEVEQVIKERIISYPLIDSSFVNLLEKISAQEIYNRHIPETYRLKNNYNAGRFIMATAGFEWQYESSYKEKSEKDKNKYEPERKEIIEFLNDKQEESKGKRKIFFENAKKNYLENQTQLANKIGQALKDSEEVLKGFIESYYTLNDIEVNDKDFEDNFKTKICPDIANRIQKQRNAIAHGNLTVEFDNSFTTDLAIMEWLFYAMILDDIGMSKENTRKSINNLFNLGFSYR